MRFLYLKQNTLWHVFKCVPEGGEGVAINMEEKIVFYLLFNKLGYLFTVGGYYFDGVDTGCEVCYFDSLNIIFYAFYTSSRKREDVYALYFFAFHRDVIGCRIRSYCNAVVFYLVYTRGVFTDYFNEYCF